MGLPSLVGLIEKKTEWPDSQEGIRGGALFLVASVAVMGNDGSTTSRQNMPSEMAVHLGSTCIPRSSAAAIASRKTTTQAIGEGCVVDRLRALGNAHRRANLVAMAGSWQRDWRSIPLRRRAPARPYLV